ncbi:MAG: TolC family protein [Rubrivivax sp.]|nr:TolC family protein [Rubrivivax sp.]
MSKLSRSACLAALGVGLFGATAQAQPQNETPSGGTPAAFADAFAAAWARHPAARSAGAARDAVALQQSAAARLLPEPASLGLGYRADKPYGSSQGARETEAEIALPLWLPGQRAALRRAADAGALQLERRLQAQRWQLAGELRELWWEARLKGAEADLAAQQLAAASALAADVERRVKAGDMARLDLNQAQSAQQAARIVSAQAIALRQASLRQWLTLTGLQALPAAAERAVDHDSAAPAMTHPALGLLQARAALASASADKARAGRYASPELGLTVTRDRSVAAEPYARSARIGLRIPLGSNSGADIDALQALTDKAEAEAEWAQEASRLAAAQAQARQDLQLHSDAVQLVQERLRLADDTLALQQRAFQLGHIDLPTRLQAQTERVDAELQAARAAVELQRAASRLNQALGVVP